MELTPNEYLVLNVLFKYRASMERELYSLSNLGDEFEPTIKLLKEKRLVLEESETGLLTSISRFFFKSKGRMFLLTPTGVSLSQGTL